MKKFLSLVLALVMTMSLVTVSAGAKDFDDAAEITYTEAVEVMSEIGIVDGDTAGNFNPTNGLTRGAAAKIICNLILGPTTAAELNADTNPYPDVDKDSVFAGYIAYCQKEGIVGGYADGTFKPANPLTGYAFMKMLLGALGYDAAVEGYAEPNWSINVAKQAIGIGLNAGLVEEFNGSDYVTREEAMLYAFNTLQATMVEYDAKTSVSVGGADVVIAGSTAQEVEWTGWNNADGNVKNDDLVQFGERYFAKLVGADDADAFGRPATTWSYKSEEIGTYVDWAQKVAEYTDTVKYKAIYSELTASTIKEYDLVYYVDGTVDATIEKEDLYRTNNADITTTGRGVLTEVFVDDVNGEIVITSMNTYLAQANTDYNAKSENISLRVYNNATGTTKVVDADDVPGIVDLKKDEFVLVNWASDNTNVLSKEVIEVSDVEIMSDVEVTKFSKATNDTSASQTNTDAVTALTVDGTEYKNNKTACYEAATLGDYYGDLLTNKTYNVYLDQYGYFIGAELYSGDDQYVFIAAYDVNNSAMGLINADALAIFTDGTMKQIKVNTKDTNINIGSTTNYTQWTTNTGDNRWYTYSEDDGVYTLAPAARWNIDVASAETTIKTDNLALTADYGTGRSFGNDESVYITVEDNTTVAWGKVIDEITGVYTGVEDVNMVVANGDWVTSVYDKDNYIIAAIVLGEAEGAVENYAYILSGANSEGKDADGNYYWTFKVVMNGEVQTLTIQSKYTNTVNNLDVGTVQELVMNGDGYVTKIVDVPNDATTTASATNKVFGNAELNAFVAVTDFDVYDVACSVALSLESRTLHIDPAYDHNGLFFARDAKAVVSQSVNGTRSEVEYATVAEAYSVLADANNNVADGLTFNGRIVAVLDANGVAQWVFFYDNTAVTSGSRPVYTSGANILNLALNASREFAVTVATPAAVTGTSWNLAVYQNGILIAQNTQSGWSSAANTAYGLTTAAVPATIPVAGEYDVVLTVYNGTAVVASGAASFVI